MSIVDKFNGLDPRVKAAISAVGFLVAFALFLMFLFLAPMWLVLSSLGFAVFAMIATALYYAFLEYYDYY